MIVIKLDGGRSNMLVFILNEERVWKKHGRLSNVFPFLVIKKNRNKKLKNKKQETKTLSNRS